ncbi:MULTISPECIES: FBP domain-containing protein [Actinoalloteichus]|uniref:Fibronectin-binding protein (FBP) n=1 Tax=Actinoalloteichus fjordicus TaxID=1612552 RepID=A0AAC9LAT9_9PSEU|nr:MULTISPECIES: FBP domain-containing protein [Actinoalloteichus]APU13262.1 Fibronectin-binding protein (FBP) [Actinoalloteichus fjordicus]APU19213.1 Fibronectin-binding protein (FBP) [Actinoalloteichus sp. GBA129-24]
MKALSQDEIRKSFVNCSKGEAKSLSLPSRFDEIAWEVQDFLGWRDAKARERAYLVVPQGEETIGLALRAAPARRSGLRSNMCAFCLTVHSLSDIALFSARRAGAAGRLGNTVGTYVCADLACPLYLRGKRKPDMRQTRESLTEDELLARMMGNVHGFVEQALRADV